MLVSVFTFCLSSNFLFLLSKHFLQFNVRVGFVASLDALTSAAAVSHLLLRVSIPASFLSFKSIIFSLIDFVLALLPNN